ncbi:MAG TPA: hypothetical protein VNC78_02105 [Actinomycetota bacterium]|nr:hypothetical protein [Actinomycetota bacterium]
MRRQLTAAIAASLFIGGASASAAYPGANGQIAFSQKCNVMVTSENGEQPTVLVDSDDCAFAGTWAPSGKRLLVVVGGDTFRNDLFIARSTGELVRELVDLPGGQGGGTWSPNGHRIVFSNITRSHPGELYKVRADGSELVRLTSKEDYGDRAPQWSPTARRIAFVSDRNGSDDIWIMSASGKNLRPLTENITRCDDCAQDTFGGIDSPSWSPSGEQLLFSANKPPESSSVYVMDADGSNLHRLGEGTGPVWSPDGQRIVFHKRRLGKLVTSKVDGSDVRELAGTDDGFGPDWQPRP